MKYPKNPGVAAVLSFLITGLGQVYNGQIAKGIVLAVLQLINIVLMSIFIGYLTFFVLWVYGIVDAYRRAERTNRQVTRI